MIDLHMHTIHSDGTENCISILKKCEEKKLDYISITDHNSVGAYFELKNIDIKNYFSGKIIEVDIAKGYGNLEIPSNIISNWITKINLF